MPRTTTVAVLALALLAAGCSINVQDDRHHGDRTSCRVECPGRQDASVSCPADRVPHCTCDPAPAASCGDARPKAK
jgi:hypothetical protein